MSTAERKQLCEQLGAASSSLRRISYFSQDDKCRQRKDLISRFIGDCKPALVAMNLADRLPYRSSRDSLYQSFSQLERDFPQTLDHQESQLIWSEEAMTLSLRLFHLSQALLKVSKPTDGGT